MPKYKCFGCQRWFRLNPIKVPVCILTGIKERCKYRQTNGKTLIFNQAVLNGEIVYCKDCL